MGRLIEIDGIEIDVVRKRGKQTLSLKIDRKTGRPQISIPFLCPLFVAKSFITGHLIWLKKNIQSTPAKQSFTDGMELSVLGQPVTITHTDTRCSVHIEENRLMVSGTPEHLHRRIKDYIKEQTYDYIALKARALAHECNVSVGSVTIRDTASRWGSCSATHGLSFCWRLALAPTFVLDYVIAHEVAHLVHMNHSDAFWGQVKKLNADTRAAKKWLKENSAYLHSFL